jgi:hypothetical protein
MKTAILATALLFSFFLLSACGRDDYSETKKDTSDTSATRDTGAARDTSATRDTAKRSSTGTSTTGTSNGAASREGGEKGKSGAVTSSGTGEPVKTKETTAPRAATSSAEKSKTSNGIGERSTVASASRSDKDQTSMLKSQTIEGVLLKVEGESFLVKDIAGKEVKLTADANTKKDGNLTIGDKVVARLEDEGILTSITKR